MKIVRVNEIFDVIYGANLELSSMEISQDGIPFVARTEKNNGVSARVKLVENIKPNPANTISVAGGGSVMSSFLQKKPYYSGRDLFYLKPKLKLSDNEMLYYCLCLRENKYRFSYGRQANKTLEDIGIPAVENIPEWVYKTKFSEINKKPLINQKLILNVENWKEFEIVLLFEFINIAKSVDLNKLSISNYGYNYIGRTKENNGKTAIVKNDNLEKLNKGKCITIAMVGNSCMSFYQKNDFFASQNILILRNKYLNIYNSLFFNFLIQQEKYRFCYGRTLTKDNFKKLKIKLPVDKNSNPDWKFMENYIKSLPYSSNI